MTAPPITPGAAQASLASDTAALLAALSAASGNVTAAALALDVPRRTIDRKIDACGLRAWLTATYPCSKRQPRKARA